MTNAAIRILYIDDDPALSRLVEKHLIRRGYAVELAADASEGIARLREGRIDVIGVDHYLPTGTGIDVLAEISRLPVPPPVVYVTGSAETAVAVAALKAGAFDYVAKTVDNDFLELLGRAMDQAVERARLLRAKERAEADLIKAKERAELLLSEVNHRVANSLAMVASLVHMQSAALDDPAAKAALAETETRIVAIAGVHRSLYTSDDVRYVDMADYLASLVGDLDRSIAAGRSVSLELKLDEVLMETDKAVYLGMIAAELVTNAIKYAYVGVAPGAVRVSLTRASEGEALLAVEDDGVGWAGHGAARGTGLGGRIVKAMAASLGGKLEYTPRERGTRATIAVHFG